MSVCESQTNKMLRRVPSAPTHPFEGQKKRECGMVNGIAYLESEKRLIPFVPVRGFYGAQPRTPGTGQLDKNRSKNRRS